MNEFVVVWIGFTVLTIFSIAIALLLAAKTGQFKNQGRARYLALWAQVPIFDKNAGGEEASPIKDDMEEKEK
jgi:hypothetical protein